MATLRETIDQYRADLAENMLCKKEEPGLTAARNRRLRDNLRVILETVADLSESTPSTGTSNISHTVTKFDCGEDINGNKVVVAINDVLYLFRPHNFSHLGKIVGVSLQAGIAGGQIDVATSGIMPWTSFALIPNNLYYAADYGDIVTATSGHPVLQSVGYAIDLDKMLLNFNTNIITI